MRFNAGTDMMINWQMHFLNLGDLVRWHFDRNITDFCQPFPVCPGQPNYKDIFCPRGFRRQQHIL